MSGVILSVIWISIVVCVTAAIFHIRDISNRFVLMFKIFVVGFAGYTTSWFVIYTYFPGFSFFSDELLIEFLNGSYIYCFLFFGVYAQVYGLADRGISLAMLTDLYESGKHSRLREEIKTSYANGRGTAYVRLKRIEQIVNSGLLRKNGNDYIATPKGLIIGRISERLQKLYGFDKTG